MKTALPFLLFLYFAGSLHAADWHATPDGAGKKDGTSWENAFDQQTLGSVFNDHLQPGDRLLLGSGIYRNALTISRGGVTGAPKTLLGVDRGGGLPVLAGEWSIEQPTKGGTALHFAAGASHIVVEGLRLRGWVFAVHAPAVKDGAPRSHLTFRDVDIEQFRHGFYLADCDDLLLKGCDLRRYSKHAFRFNEGCDRVTLRHCTADCSEGDAEWEKKTELFPYGFFVNNAGAPNTAFVFEDCLARHNVMPLQTTGYKNGDGFVIEGNTTDVVFVRCRSIRNQDGGFDLKVRDVRLTDCVSSGNYRGFRIWTTATLTNCFAGWSATGLWCNGGPVTVTRTTFHALRDEAVQTDKEATQPVTLRDCLISSTVKSSRQRAAGEVILQATVVTDADPQYARPDPAWDGVGDALNSRAFPEKGYRNVPEKSAAKSK